MEYKPSFVDQLDVDYISHHGIKGQKWGVRRYQNSDGSLTPEGRIRYGVDERYRTHRSNNPYDKRNQQVTKEELIGLAVAGGILAAYGGYKLASNIDLKSDPYFDKEAGFIKQKGDHDPISDLYNSNPLYEIPGKQYINNCPRATLAYELRRRGYDVRATGSYGGMSTSMINDIYKNAEVHNIDPIFKDRMKEPFDAPDLVDTQEYEDAQDKTVDDIFSTCASFGPKARGTIEVKWQFGGGHILSFENDAKGKPILMDAQIAQTDKHTSWIARKYNKLTGKIPYKGTTTSHGDYDSWYADNLRMGISPCKPCRVRRTDNADLDFDLIHEYGLVQNPSMIKRKTGIGV